MQSSTPDYDFMRRTYETALNCGLEMIPPETAARILAVLAVNGNNEMLTHCPKLVIELHYIQERYGFKGGEVPNANVVQDFQFFVRLLNRYKERNSDYMQWAKDLFKERYGVRLIN